MKIKHFFLLFLLIPIFAFTLHKYYLSLTQIEFNNSSKSIEVITNVFVDDIETVLNKINAKDLRLNTKKEPADSDIYFEKYLKNHIQFKINNKAVSFDYLGKEYDGDIVYFYLEIKNVTSIQILEIENTLLVTEFPKQQNLIKSKVNGKHKSLLLTKKKNKGLLKY